VRWFAKMLKLLGYVVLYLGIAFILVGIISTWWFEGFGAVQEILSPFNVVSYLVIVATLAPGIFLIWVSGKLEEKSKIGESEK